MSQPRRQTPRAEPVRTAQLESPKFALDSYLASMLEEATDFADEDDLDGYAETPEPTLTDMAEEGAPAAAQPTESKPNLATRHEANPDNSPEPSAVDQPEPALHAAPKPAPEPTPAVPEPAPAEAQPETPQVSARSADTRIITDQAPDAAVAEAQLAQSEQPLAWNANGRPAWAARRFDCLLFKVDGLALAVPMVLLGTIFPMDNELTPLFGQPDWFLGLLSVTDKRNIKVIETARLVMPERYREEAAQTLKYAVGIHGCDWALACHEVVGSITLEPDEVKWRSERTRRPWLAGTVVEHMCALIDLEAFEQALLVSRPRAVARR